MQPVSHGRNLLPVPCSAPTHDSVEPPTPFGTGSFVSPDGRHLIEIREEWEANRKSSTTEPACPGHLEPGDLRIRDLHDPGKGLVPFIAGDRAHDPRGFPRRLQHRGITTTWQHPHRGL